MACWCLRVFIVLDEKYVYIKVKFINYFVFVLNRLNTESTSMETNQKKFSFINFLFDCLCNDQFFRISG